MSAELIKAILINAAYQGAHAVCGDTIAQDVPHLPIDPLIQDANVQKKGVFVYEEAKVQYAAILRAFHDHTGIWPDPKVETSVVGGSSAATNPAALLPAVVSQLTGLLGKAPRDTAISTLGTLVDVLAKLAIPDPVKVPGQELKS